MLQMYEHQTRMLGLISDFFRVNRDQKSVVIEGPCAFGKSLLAAELIKKVVTPKLSRRVVSVVHVHELVEQNYDAMIEQWPEMENSIGINAASLNRRDTKEKILFCNINSVHNKAYEIGKTDLLIIDEVHLMNDAADSMYLRFILDLKTINPDMRIVGMSGTPYRLGGGLLIEGDNRIFDFLIPAKAAGASIGELISKGFLCPLTVPSKTLEATIDTSEVKKNRYDFSLSALAKAVDEQGIVHKACKEALRLAKDRHSWIVFGINVDNCVEIQRSLAALGQHSEVLTGDTTKTERKRITKDFKSGKLRIIISVVVLTIGFNATRVDCIVDLAPTASPNRYVQKYGRGMRLDLTKEDCLILDFALNIDLHGPIDNIIPPKRRKKKDNELPPLRECSKCYMLIAASQRTCPYCGHYDPVMPQEKIQETASTSAILTGIEDPYSQIKVDDWIFSLHNKPGQPKSVQVIYYKSMDIVQREWVCVSHSHHSKGGQKARRWWEIHMPSQLEFGEYEDTEEAIKLIREHARQPTKLMVKKNGKFFDIKRRAFNK